MSTKVLVIDLNPGSDKDPFHGPEWLPEGVEHRMFKACHEPFPTEISGYTHLMLSGSTDSIVDDHPYVAPAMELICDAVDNRKPVLGICYGHQLIARALLGLDHVRTAAKPEMNWGPIHVLPGHGAIFDGLDNPFNAFVGHFDEVCNLPYGWDIIAYSTDCQIQGMINKRLRILGFQFHPEFTAATGAKAFADGKEWLMEKGVDVTEAIENPKDDGSGAILIPRWLKMKWPDL